MTPQMKTLLEGILKSNFSHEEVRHLSRVVQQLYYVHAPCMVRGKQFLKGLPSVPKEFLEQVIADSQNPMYKLISGDGESEDAIQDRDLHAAMWELRRRKFLAGDPNTPSWDFNYLPYLLQGEKPHEMEKCGVLYTPGLGGG